VQGHLISPPWPETGSWGLRKGWKRRLAVITVVLVLAPAGLAAVIRAASASAAGDGSASASPVPPPPPGWTTAYGDSFSGPAGSGVDPSWTYDTGTRYRGTGCAAGYGTGEVERTTRSAANVSEDGSGHLTITAVRSGTAASPGGSWTSGRIETTADRYAAPAGGEMEVTASIRQPDPVSGTGYWPAFWMLGSGFRSSGAGTAGTMDCASWPAVGEIDIMEDVNALSQVSGTLHCGTDPGGPCDESSGLGSGLTACPGCQAGYDTYSVVVNRTDTSDESITYYRDGSAYYTVTERETGAAAWSAAVDHGFFLILDLALGGGYPDGVCGCAAPSGSASSGGSMSVGYVAVYTKAGPDH
jgi:beta-glucanase (GH16 family)